MLLTALILSATWLPISLALTSNLTQITTDFGPNPSNVSFHIYVPTTLAAHPPILVNPHWCHGSAPLAFLGGNFALYADLLGFIVIYPGSPHAADSCWDVSSRQTLTHRAGGDSLGIVSMVQWAISTYRADARRVFVTGVSSGGMMTNVLVGAYPDVFAAGSAWADVPFGCFAPSNNSGAYDYWNADCAEGRVTHTPSEWKAIVQAAWPGGYDGWRPKMQVWHGTADETVNYTNFLQDIVEWTAVLGLSETPTATYEDTPTANWTKYVYGPNDWFEAISAFNVTHNIPVGDEWIMEWFDLNCTEGCFSWGQGSPKGGLVSIG